MDMPKERAGLRRYMVRPMKTSLATTISIAGVVAAGAFTFAVNSTMLTSVSTSSDMPPVDAAVLMPGNTQLAVLAPPVSAVVTGANVGSQSVPVAPTTTVQVGQSTVSSYSLPGAASVQLVQSPSHLKVGVVTLQDGYVYSAENLSATRVIVTLTNSSHRLKFNAEIIGGRVVTSLIASDVIAPAAPAAPAAAASPSSTTPSRTRNKQRGSRNHQEDEDNERDEREDHDDD
jgi:ribosomal protein L12E/L44/L45/RPP1/RPP2